MKNRKFKTTKTVARALETTFSSMSMTQNGVVIRIKADKTKDEATVTLSCPKSAEKSVLHLAMSVFIDFEEPAPGHISERFICQTEAFKQAPQASPAY